MKAKTIKWDGRPISEPGIYSGIDIDLYHAANICVGPSISSSGLRTIFLRSAAHFYAEWRGNPNRIEKKESRAFIVGRAVHHLILGEPFFAKKFAIQPEDYEDEKTGEIKPWNNNANACKKWHAARKEEARSVLTQAEVTDIKGMAKELSHNKIVQHGALNGMIERSIFWRDSKTGIWLKSRPDSIPGDSGDYVDLKTTESVEWRDLVRTIGDYGYNQQGDLICTAAREVLDVPNPTFTLVFQEKKQPWCSRVVTLKENELERGHRQNRYAIDCFAACLKSKRWPGPGGDSEDAEPIELSDYAQKAVDDKLTIAKSRKEF